ncbi:hypothetical protein [Bacillus ndiopicus]|uniref:hypothetical protein n=1 Tax=Bacillus ndiopicus TaxID=1347368 RepID=UPI0005A9A0B4|nr:hypothetical protein [Bacillus ndiopicus]
MKKKLFIMASCFVILSGCMTQGAQYSAKNNDWEVKLDLTFDKAEGMECHTGAIKYLGEEPYPKEVKYSVTNNSNLEMGGTGVLDQYGVLNFGKGCGSATALIDKGNEAEIKIEWDGKSETLQLDVK